jgi:hypothetical protein
MPEDSGGGEYEWQNPAPKRHAYILESNSQEYPITEDKLLPEKCITIDDY